jgi:hypothetical protein
VRAIVQIAHQDLSVKRLHLFLQFSAFQRKLVIESVVIVRLFGEGRCHFFSLGEVVNPHSFRIGLEGFRVSEFAFLVIDEVDGAVVDESVEIEGYGCKDCLIGQEEDVIILGYRIVCPDVFLRSLVDIGVVFGAVGEFGVAELAVVVVPEAVADVCEYFLREDGEGGGQMLSHVEIND